MNREGSATLIVHVMQLRDSYWRIAEHKCVLSESSVSNPNLCVRVPLGPFIDP